jgi:hypothetical protein
LLLHELQRFDEALESYGRALVVRLDFVEALNNAVIPFGRSSVWRRQ